jgi:hypothetical protein
MSTRRLCIVCGLDSRRHAVDKAANRFFHYSTAYPDLIGRKPAFFGELVGLAIVSHRSAASREDVAGDPIFDKCPG